MTRRRATPTLPRPAYTVRLVREERDELKILAIRRRVTLHGLIVQTLRAELARARLGGELPTGV